MTKCPNCKHEWKNDEKSRGGKKSKRTDMEKGGPGQLAAHEGKRKKKLIAFYLSVHVSTIRDLTDEKKSMWREGQELYGALTKK